MLAQLFDAPPAPPKACGYWSVLRLCVDLATQEWLNVGVVLDAENGGARQYRLLSNLSGLRCLYNDDAVESARFLLDQAEHMLETGAPIPHGWHIALSPPKFAQGPDAQTMVDKLFARMVPMGLHQLAQREDREDHPHATMSVRKTVRQLLNKHLQLAKSDTPEFWRRSPTSTQRNGSGVLMDLQIVAHTQGALIHGAVASAWYKTRYHRNASLSQAVNAMTTASQAYPQSNNVLYLLRPPAGAGTLTAADHQAIAQDIESSRWLLHQHEATLKTANSEAEMAQTILRDLHMLQEVQ